MPEGDINQAVELFKSRDPRKRRWAVDLAAELGTREAAALLVRALQDQSWSLREYAIEKAVRMGRPMVAPLCRLLNSGIWFSRGAAVQALRGIGDIRALGPLCRVLDDSNRVVAESARSTVEQLLAANGDDPIIQQVRAMDQPALARFMMVAGKRFSELTVPTPEDNGQGPQEESALQQLRAAVKTSTKQQARYEDEEP